jgi:glutamyl-tRNA(Gln) amidotransferase subunit E
MLSGSDDFSQRTARESSRRVIGPKGASDVKAGLEVHQQLATGKLFCECPSEFSEEVRGSFARRLRAAGGEDRGVDPAASFQASRGLRYRYEIVPTSCLVEMDEEPPHPLNEEALDTALTLALLLDAHPMDEVLVMRKIVVDGSNTSGFQRTTLVATDGKLEVGGHPISIISICLEEDAARKVGESEEEVTYRLDRLGIPLVEIATGPDIRSGLEAREVAQEIGALLRATRRVRRGIGTIREDVNVSTEGGRRIEIKGVQELRKIQEYVDGEVARQTLLLTVRDELRRRQATVPDRPPLDVSELCSGIASGPLAESARVKRVVLAIGLLGFGGLLHSPTGTEERLGRELADQARAVGLRGLLHSDELPGYGLDAERVEEIRRRLALGPDDAFVLVSDRSRERAERALRGVVERARAALEGIPGETRDPLPDGRTRYSRPLPGRDRMYPETDVPPTPITADRLARLRRSLPERPEALRARLEQAHSLPSEVVRQIVYSDDEEAFEELTRRGHDASLVVRLLLQELPAASSPTLGRPTLVPTIDALDALLTAVESGRFAKEGIAVVLSALASGAPSLDAAIERAGLSGFTAEDLTVLVERIVRSNEEVVRRRGEDSFSPLMGDVMKEVRGRRDGKEVADALRRQIAKLRSETGS